MNYCEWNNLLGDFFFNDENEGQTVSLIISEPDIIELGRTAGGFEGDPDTEIIQNFKNAWVGGFPGSYGNIVQRLNAASQASLYAFQRDENSFLCDGTLMRFPAALCYFSGVSLALTNGSAGSRYTRIREYFGVSAEQFPNMGNDLNWNRAYDKLVWWANKFKKGALGYLPQNTLSSLRYEYMAKPYTFILLSKKQLTAFHQNLYETETEPGTVVSQAGLLKAMRSIHADSRLIDILQGPLTDDRKAAVAILNSLYRIWDGQATIETQNGKAAFQLRKLRLCFSLDNDSGYAFFSFRFREELFKDSQIDFGTAKTSILPNNWSKPIAVSHIPGNTLLNDPVLGLRAVFKPADNKLFVFANGRPEGLNSEIHIEASHIERTGPQFIFLCAELFPLLSNWLAENGGHDVTEDLVDFKGWIAYSFSEGFCSSFREIEKLNLPERVTLEYREGLKGNNRGEFIATYGLEAVLSGASGRERLVVTNEQHKLEFEPDGYGIFTLGTYVPCGVFEVTLTNTDRDVFIPNYGRLVITDILYPEFTDKIFKVADLTGPYDLQEKQNYQNAYYVVDNMRLVDKTPPQLGLWEDDETTLDCLSPKDINALQFSEYLTYKELVSKPQFDDAFNMFFTGARSEGNDKTGIYTLLALTASCRFRAEYNSDGNIRYLRPVRPFLFRLGNFHNYSANTANTPFTGGLYVLGGAYSRSCLNRLAAVCDENNILFKIYSESEDDGLPVPPSVFIYTAGRTDINPVLRVLGQDGLIPYYQLTRESESIADKMTKSMRERQSEGHFEDRCKLFSTESLRFYKRPATRERVYPSLALYEMSPWDHVYTLRFEMEGQKYQLRTDPRYGKLMILQITGNTSNFYFDAQRNVLALPSRLRPPAEIEADLYYITGRLPVQKDLYQANGGLSSVRGTGRPRHYLIYKGILKNSAEKLAGKLGQNLNHTNIIL